MRFIDPTIYASRRSAAELEMMSTAGIIGVIEPVTWYGTGRRYAETFVDDFDRLVGPEARRANHYNIGYGAAIGVPAQEANNFAVAQAVIEAMPRFLKNQENVVAIGEVGLERGTGAEEEIFRRQIRLAKQYNLPVVALLPTHDRREICIRTIQLFAEESFPAHAALINGVTDETLPYVREFGCWYGLTLDRNTHLSPERAVHLMQHQGLEGALLHSAAGRLLGDPLAVPRAARLMKEAGFSIDAIEKVTFHNPKWFFSQGRPMPLPAVARREERQTEFNRHEQGPRPMHQQMHQQSFANR